MADASYGSRFARPVFLWPMAALLTDVMLQVWSPRAKWLALLPLVPMFFFIAALVGTIRRMDELQQRISQESAFVAYVLTQVLVLVFFGLERAALARPHWNDLGECMLILWACSYVLIARRYK